MPCVGNCESVRTFFFPFTNGLIKVHNLISFRVHCANRRTLAVQICIIVTNFELSLQLMFYNFGRKEIFSIQMVVTANNRRTFNIMYLHYLQNKEKIFSDKICPKTFSVFYFQYVIL